MRTQAKQSAVECRHFLFELVDAILPIFSETGAKALCELSPTSIASFCLTSSLLIVTDFSSLFSLLTLDSSGSFETFLESSSLTVMARLVLSLVVRGVSLPSALAVDVSVLVSGLSDGLCTWTAIVLVLALELAFVVD